MNQNFKVIIYFTWHVSFTSYTRYIYNNKFHIASVEKSTIRLKDVAGLEDIKDEGTRICTFFK